MFMTSLRVLVLCGWMITGAVTPAMAMGDAGFVQQTLTGKKAQDFTLETVRSQKITLSKYIQGKKAILLFWTTWCPYCRVAVKEINAMRDKIAAMNITVIFISTGEPAQTIARYLENNRYDFDVALDSDQSVSDAYRLMGVPTLVYIDEEGIIKSVEHQFSSDFETIFK